MSRHRGRAALDSPAPRPHSGGMTYTAVTQPTIGQRVTNPYRHDASTVAPRSGVIRAVLGDPRYVMVLCDDDIVRTMDTHHLVTTTTN